MADLAEYPYVKDEACCFDIHCHTMTLDHANLPAFLQRFRVKAFVIKMTAILLAAVVILWALRHWPVGRGIRWAVVAALVVAAVLLAVYLLRLSRRVVNLLAEMGSAIGDQYVLLERNLAKKWGDCAHPEEPPRIIVRGEGDEECCEYRRIILTPLIVDFGAKGLLDRRITGYYRELPRKPVVKQTADLLEGIAYYTRHTQCHLFEIYPFLGLNPQFYPLDKRMDTRVRDVPEYDESELPAGIKIETDPSDRSGYVITDGEMAKEAKRWLYRLFHKSENNRYAIKRLYDDSRDQDRGTTLPELLDKYFRDYTGRREDLFAHMGAYKGDIDCMGSNVFAGIKLYPPLGFDPWPSEHCQYQREKVRRLYGFCQEKQIPITVHCSVGGFIGTQDGKEAMRLVTPHKWVEVLKEYPNLRLNFAHLGRQDRGTEWQRVVLDLLERYPNVYTDFANCAVSRTFYDRLSRLIAEHPHAKERLLFGSDFMVNLLETDSYAEYYGYFLDAKNALSAEDRHQFFHVNPKRFLFER